MRYLLTVVTELIKRIQTVFFLLLAFTAFAATAQIANDSNTQDAILAAIPNDLTSANASADDIATAARTVAFTMEGELNSNLTQVMVSLGELTRQGVFESAPRSGRLSPTLRFYNSVLNLSSATNAGVTPQYITGVTQAMTDGMNFLNGAEISAEKED